MLTYTPADIRTAIRASTLSDIRQKALIKKLRVFPSWDQLPDSIKWNVCRAKLSRGCWDWLGWDCRTDWAHGIHRGGSPIPLWDGRPCKLLVIAEEGIGDEIMAASCFAELFTKTPDTVVECDPRLVEVFSRSFGERFVPRVTRWEDREADMILPMLDLLPMFRRSPKDCPGVPYLKPDPQRVAYWRDVLPVHVGVAWKSRHGRIKPPPIDAVSLQYKETDGRFYQHDLDPVADFADQINLIAALDCVVSGPMSVVHAAGALGVKTHVIMPPRGTGDVNNTLHWRYECNLPFYASARVHCNWIEARRCLEL